MCTRTEKKKIKLLYVVESFATGVYSVIKDLACNLPAEKFDITIIHSLRNDSPPNYEEDLSNQNIKLIYVPMDSISNCFKAVKNIRRQIKQITPDIVHLHSSKAGVIGRLACRATGFKNVFYSPHGFAFLRQDVNIVKRKLFFISEKVISIIAGGTTIAVSEGELEHALKVSKNAIKVNNFIDISQFPETDTNENSLIVTSGRIMPQKNPNLFNLLANQIPQAVFLWIGDGDQRYKLKASNIKVSGYLTRAEVIARLSEAAVYTQTSLWEGMPVSVLEAMAMGLPVVATNVIGNRDIIRDGETGFLCETENTAKFTEIITNLLNDSKEREKIGKNARRFIIENHSIEAAIAQYDNIYQSSLN